MSRFLVTIDTDNEAFEWNGWQKEAAKVLSQLAARLTESRDGDVIGTLYDGDNMECGAWDYLPDEP